MQLKSYKQAYPFTLSCPSFIYPADYVPNVKQLAPHVDEIELLFLESGLSGCNRVSEQTIKELASLARPCDITYNVHLPTDIDLSEPDAAAQQTAVRMIKNIIEQAACLSPSTNTLHLSYKKERSDRLSVQKWQKDVSAGLDKLLGAGIRSRLISVETLNYPFHWLDKIIQEFDLSVCIDTGHLIVHGYDILDTYRKYSDRVSIIHLHGVDGTKDHVPIDRLPDKEINDIMTILKTFTGVVSLEVFSVQHLQDSLIFLEKIMTKCDVQGVHTCNATSEKENN